MTDPAELSVQELNKQAVDLVAQIAGLTAKVEALSDDAAAKRRELRAAFRQAHEYRFNDLDAKRALIGAKTEHAITIAGTVSFFIRPPAMSTVHAVDAFIATPVLTDTDPTKAVNMGPISEVERTLLGWVTGVQLLADPNSIRQDLQALSIGNRLKALRSLPEALLTRVADEASLLQNWLNVVLEIELGNF